MNPIEATTPPRTTLAVGPGDGVLARRDTAVLFVPSPDESTSALVDAFCEAADADIWAAVSQTVIDGSFTCPPFVFVDVGGEITLRVFGDVSVTTDLPSVPMLSGASSSTWVEHNAPGSGRLAAPASITTGSMPDSPVATDLQGGVVPGGGFTLVVQPADVVAGEPDTDEPVTDEPDTALDEPVDRVARALDVLGTPEAPPHIEVVEPETGTGETDEDEDRTLPPPEPVGAEPRAAEPSVGEPSVTARLCGEGHPNRPSRLTCSFCDAFLTPGDEGLRLVPRPIVGTLVFDDGIKVDLDKPVVIGRAPEAADGDDSPVETLVFDSDRVSRTHLEVRLSEWDVAVVDRESRNGTVVVPADGAQPVKVDPSAPQLIEPGAVVYFGTRSFTLR